MLEALRQSTGVTSRVLLRDEPDAPSPVVGPGEEALAAGGPGRYQVLGEIARGGMGIVLKGRDPDLGRDVAMKVLHPGHAGDPAMIRRFIEEAQIGGQLQHPGILPVYELGLDADLRPYFTMRLVKGRTLAALLEERPDPAHDLGRFLSVFEQVCQTVAYAHARGVIHRDLKPSNIMVGAFGEVQVVDWGLSKVLRQGGERQPGQGQPAGADEPHVTTVRTTGGGMPSQSGSIIGTPSYMSPEQARGEVDDLDEQADVFALGAILCEILTGQPPYIGSRPQILEDAAAGRLDDAFARLDSCGAEDELIRLARRCLDPSRAVRPRHAGVPGARSRPSWRRSATAPGPPRSPRPRRGPPPPPSARRGDGRPCSPRRSASPSWPASPSPSSPSASAGPAPSSRSPRWPPLPEGGLVPRPGPAHPARPARPLGGALAQVRRTAEIVGAGAIDEDARKNVVRLLDELRKEEQGVRECARQHRASRREGPSDSPHPPRQDQE